MPASLNLEQRELFSGAVKSILDQHAALFATTDVIRSLIEQIHAATYSGTAEYALKWNAHSGALVNRLPTELLARAFGHLDLQDRFTVRLISHTWNATADAPSIWSNIVLDYETRRAPIKWLESLFARSMDAPIDLQIDYFSEKLVPSLQAVMFRVRKLEAEFNNPSPSVIAAMLGGPISRLESLRLGSLMTPPFDGAISTHVFAFPKQISAGGLCPLQILELGLFTLPEQATWTIPSLRKFIGTLINEDPSVKKLFKFFPQLEALDLRSQKFDFIPDGPFTSTLQDLALRSDTDSELDGPQEWAILRERVAHNLQRLNLDHLEDLDVVVEMFLRAAGSTRIGGEREWMLMDCHTVTGVESSLWLMFTTLNDGEDIDGSSIDWCFEPERRHDYVYYASTFINSFNTFVRSDFGHLITSSKTLTALKITVNMANALLCCGNLVDMPAVWSLAISVDEGLLPTLIFVPDHVDLDVVGAVLDPKTRNIRC